MDMASLPSRRRRKLGAQPCMKVNPETTIKPRPAILQGRNRDAIHAVGMLRNSTARVADAPSTPCCRGDRPRSAVMSGSISPMVMMMEMLMAWPEVRDPMTSQRRPAGGAFCIKDVLPIGD